MFSVRLSVARQKELSLTEERLQVDSFGVQLEVSADWEVDEVIAQQPAPESSQTPCLHTETETAPHGPRSARLSGSSARRSRAWYARRGGRCFRSR